MILSLRHRFVFIKGMKVAGTSIEMALSPLCGPDDIVTPILPIEESERLKTGGTCRNYATVQAFEALYLQALARMPRSETANLAPPRGPYFNHMSLTDLCAARGEPLTDFTIVCAVRSPYEKVISWLNMAAKIEDYRRGGTFAGGLADIGRRFDRSLERGSFSKLRNIDRYRWPDGALPVPLLRHEHLERDFAALLERLGIAGPVRLPHAKDGMLPRGLDPRSVLRPDQIKAIGAFFADEFETFGYPML